LDDVEKMILVRELAEHVNCSVVGASKVLHIICPDFVPFTDSRVIRGWNSFFQKEIETNQIFKLPSSWNFNQSNLANKVLAFVNYWNTLLEWKRNIGGNITIRHIEVLFYFIGGKDKKGL
jgi:hypothetical protein